MDPFEETAVKPCAREGDPKEFADVLQAAKPAGAERPPKGLLGPKGQLVGRKAPSKGSLGSLK